MLILNNCSVVFEDDILPAIPCKGVVTVFGESPNATIQISAPDYSRRKFNALDRISNAKIESRNGSHVITGYSSHLRTTVGASRENSKIKILVDANQPCESKEETDD